MQDEELFPLVDRDGAVIGSAPRSRCHGDPSLLHPVAHCLVTNAAGDLLLQLRSQDKLIQPGKWDTSVGGHVTLGESVEQALARECREEIGLDTTAVRPRPCYSYHMRNDLESELVYTYTCTCEGPFTPLADEIDELRFWTRGQIRDRLGSGIFTPNFEDEFARFIAWCRS